MIRCVSLDWLEVYVIEHTPLSFKAYQWGHVVQREYGTRVYREMFTVTAPDGFAIEVRRQPVSSVLQEGSAHIRVTNASLYMPFPVQRLEEFLEFTGCQFVSVSKVDICLDFLKFDDNTSVMDFIARYMKGAYSKVNQSNVSAHGVDMWDGRVFHSLAWGSKSSPIFTRLYNKTLELTEGNRAAWRVKKPYIPLYWESCGLITHEELTTTLPDVWRLEFSIHSAVRGWTTIDLDGNSSAKYSIRNLLSCYDDRRKCLAIFMALAGHYFHFKRYVPGVRKDRCPERVLFKWEEHELVKPYTTSNTNSTTNTIDVNFLQSFYFSLLKCISDYDLPSSYSMEHELSELLGQLYHTKQSSVDVNDTFHSLHISNDIRR